MRTRKVNRYWCDFCGKAGLSGSHMAKHEKHCTMNPNRECRVCKMVEANQKPIAVLVALLPDISGTPLEEAAFLGFSDLELQLKNTLPKLREAAGNCPACILAALRQAKIPVPAAHDFNFTEEMKSVWRDINDAQTAEEGHHG